MADFIWPSDLAPYASSFYLQHSTRVNQSPYSHERQTLGLAPARWICKLSFRGGGIDRILSAHDRGARLDALLAALRGPQSSVLLYDFRRPKGRGDHTAYAQWYANKYANWGAGFVPETPTHFTDGTFFTDLTGFMTTMPPKPPPLNIGPVANAASGLGATTIGISGFGLLQKVLMTGDYIGFGDQRCYVVTADAVTDNYGSATISFQPPLHHAVVVGVPIVTAVPVKFRLDSDDAGSNPTSLTGLSEYQLDFTEDLTP